VFEVLGKAHIVLVLLLIYQMMADGEVLLLFIF
jgi:hypothetical protein